MEESLVLSNDLSVSSDRDAENKPIKIFKSHSYRENDIDTNREDRHRWLETEIKRNFFTLSLGKAGAREFTEITHVGVR